jgi:HAD superfamily hydrolase (TIGR01509 family)
MPVAAARTRLRVVTSESGPGIGVDLDRLAVRWRAALDAADGAQEAAGYALTSDELALRGKQLARERETATRLLVDLAHDLGRNPRFVHLVPRRDARHLLGLDPSVGACVFNLNGVLIESDSLHAAAWTEAFDELLLARGERTHGEFAPFNPRTDYAAHLHGRPRLDGVRSFLASRGIRLPEGEPGDSPGVETVHGLANRKGQSLLRRIAEQGVRAYEGSLHYLETAREAGVHCAVVSASANTPTVLERAGLRDLIDGVVDGNTVEREHLRAKPAPDTLLAACQQLGIEPGRSAAFETSAAGIVAARAGGFEVVVGVTGTGPVAELQAGRPDVLVSSLADLLEHNLAA